MIIKSISSKTPRFRQLLDYVNKSREKTVNERGESFVLTRFLEGKTNEEIAREFMATESRRLHKRANNTRLLHELLSFSDLDKEKITIEHLKTLTEAYISKRNPLMQAYAVGHFNENHVHVHIIASPVEVHTGRSVRISKSDFASIKRELQEIQKQFPELQHSFVDHGRKSRGRERDDVSEKEKTMAVRRPDQLSNKARIREAIESCMIMAESKEHFFELLSQEGFKPYQRGGEYKGISDCGRNYRFSTLLNDYSEWHQGLDEKSERLEDIEQLRSNLIEFEREYGVESNPNTDDETEDDAANFEDKST